MSKGTMGDGRRTTGVQSPKPDVKGQYSTADVQHEPSAVNRQSSVGSISDPATWDRALLSSENAGLLQCWQWGEFKRQSGWYPLRLMSREAANPNIPPVFAQVLFRKLPGLPVSIAYVPRGPVY